MRSILVSLTLALSLNTAAFALETHEVSLFFNQALHGSTGADDLSLWLMDRTGQHEYGTLITPMNEEVADALADLDQTKAYACQAKYLRGGTSVNSAYFYDLRGCKQK